MLSNELEWLNKNMTRNYPIIDGVVTNDIYGSYLPSDFLVDMRLFIPKGLPTTNQNTFYISKILKVYNYIYVYIGYKDINNNLFDCAISTGIPIDIKTGTEVKNKTFTLIPSDNIPETYNILKSISGYVIIGTSESITKYPDMFFEYDNTTILDSLILSFDSNGTSITFSNDSDNIENTVVATFYDSFNIQASDGIEFSIIDNNTLVIKRTPTTEELNETLTSVDDVVNAVKNLIGTPITKINGIKPDIYGNIQIVGADCTSITSVTSGISISNTCSKPCCTESSAEDLTNAIQQLEEARQRLEQYYTTLSNNINSMQSRLSSLITAGS